MSNPVPKQWLLTGERSKCRLMICKHCGVELVTYSQTRIYCSQKCYYHKTPEERFNANINKTNEDGCWLWTAAKDKDGYGFFRMGKEQRAHRVAWIFSRGSIPAGRWVLHQCDNPTCVNPDHLFLGDADANNKDMLSKGRQRYAYGELQSPTLKNEDVIKIRQLHADGKTQRSIAQEFGIGYKAINKIVLRQRWRHI